MPIWGVGADLGTDADLSLSYIQSLSFTAKAVSFIPTCGDVYFILPYVIKWFAAGYMFSTGTAVSSTDKAEILLKIVLNTDKNNPKRITGKLFKYV